MRGSDEASHPDSWPVSHGIVLRVSGLSPSFIPTARSPLFPGHRPRPRPARPPPSLRTRRGRPSTAAASPTRPKPGAMFSPTSVNKTKLPSSEEKRFLTQCQTRTSTRSSARSPGRGRRRAPGNPGLPAAGPRFPAGRATTKGRGCGRAGASASPRSRATGRPAAHSLTSARAAAGAPQAGAGGGGALPRAAARALLSGRRPPRRLHGLCRRRPRGRAGPARAPPPPRPPPSLGAGPRGLGALVPAEPHAAAAGARPGVSVSAGRARQAARAQSSRAAAAARGRRGPRSPDARPLPRGRRPSAAAGCAPGPGRGWFRRVAAAVASCPARPEARNRGVAAGASGREVAPPVSGQRRRRQVKLGEPASRGRPKSKAPVAAFRPGAPHEATPDAEPPVAG